MPYGVSIKTYHTDNLRFNDNNFKGDCIKGVHSLTYCDIGAHHQNKIVKKIKLGCYSARTVLLHTNRKQSDVISASLWPYTIQTMVERHNRLSLNTDGQIPIENFVNIDHDIDPTIFHIWGFPLYIITKSNQGATRTPKWETRSRTGIYLGYSPCHTSTVALVLNLRTGYISPQFHVFFDEKLSTAPYMTLFDPSPNWLLLLQHSSEKATNDQTKLSNAWLHLTDQQTYSTTAILSLSLEYNILLVPTTEGLNIYIPTPFLDIHQC